MAEQKCCYSTELWYRKPYKCDKPVLPSDFKCILHSKHKDLNDFAYEVSRIIIETANTEEIDLIGCYFPKSFDNQYFKGRTFSKRVNLSYATFTGEIDFSGAIFSKGATFYKAEFKQHAIFRETSFEGQMTTFREAKFNGVGFHGTLFRGKEVSFSGTQFIGKTDFDAPHFYGKVYFLRTQFRESCTIRWIEIRTAQQPVFEDVTLSQCRFLHSNIDKVDFRYCKFNEKSENLLFVLPHRRQNILMDELDVDEKVSQKPRDIKSRQEQYERVRRLYLELKRNFEDKKDWNTAGDFHYGEMECRRNMKGWWGRKLLSLEAAYFHLSGYGERPKKAFFWLMVIILSFALCYMPPAKSSFPSSDLIKAEQNLKLQDEQEGKSLSVYEWFTVIPNETWRNPRFQRYRKGLNTSLRVTFHLDTEEKGWASSIQSIFGLLQFALFALALRRRVKR